MAKNGDYVKIITKNKTFEGVLIPRPEILENDITVIKLDNGYNIGIKTSKIESTEVMKPFKEKTKTKISTKLNPDLPTVAILSFGGTIASRIDYRTGGVVADYTAEDFKKMCPELETIANIETKVVNNIMSEDMNSKDWILMAKEINNYFNDPKIKGIVVSQGTDTLHFSTSAMSFMTSPNKPVIFTASQRSIDRGSSDAFMNLICSVVAATKFDGAEIATCMHATSDDEYNFLIRGTKVRKMHTSRRDAFRPINELPLAKVFPSGKIEIINKNYKKIPKDSKTKTKLKNVFEEKTALVHIHPNIDPKIIDFYIDQGYKGIVIAATALGHVPTKDLSFLPVLERAKKEKVSIVIASQTLYGETHPFVYSNLRELSVKLDCIFVKDLTPETAFVKLGWVLGQKVKFDKVKELMLENVAGEFGDKEIPESYLY